MFNNLFSKIMGSYLLIPLLILLALLTILPNYLEDYFFKAKELELLRKGEMAVRLIRQGDYNHYNEIDNFLGSLERLLDTSLIVIDQEGEIINKGMRMRELMRRPSMNRMHGAMMHNRMHRALNDAIPSRIMNFQEELDKVLAGERTSFRGEIEMLKQPIIGVGIPLYTSKKMALFLISPLSGLQETVIKVRNLTLRVTLIAVLLALILGYFISKGITRPVLEMKKQAQKMARGDYQVQIANLPKDEIGELGESFNYLSNKLEENIEELSREKQRMHEMLTSMAEGVLGVGSDKKILLANPRFKEIFEVKEEIIGKSSIELVNENLMELIDKVLVEEEELKEEFTWEEKIIVAHAAPVREKDAKLWGIIILVRDVTEIRKLDEMRRLFVANVSHELKTPLTAIRGYLEAILDGVVDDAKLQGEYLTRVLTETKRMTRLVQEILNLARLQSGQIEFDLREFELLVLVNKVVRNLESKLEDRTVSVEGKQELVIKSDQDKLEEVLVNLLSNAIKFTASNGEIRIKVEEDKDRVKIKVRDNGIGIPKAELSYIWERFHQVDRARTPDQEGTGLGLAIVKEIIEALGGEVAINSREGIGSEFIITL
jgi:two-component system sensor histidine kinase ResE